MPQFKNLGFPSHRTNLLSSADGLVNSDSAAPRPQRRAAAEGVKRNAEILRQMQEQAEEKSPIYSSDEGGCRDWGEAGDNPSDDDDWIPPDHFLEYNVT